MHKQDASRMRALASIICRLVAQGHLSFDAPTAYLIGARCLLLYKATKKGATSLLRVTWWFDLNSLRRGPWRGTVCGRGLLAWTRGQPTATGVGSLSHSYHITRSYCSLARPIHTHSLVLETAISRMRAGPMVPATCWSSKLSTPRSHRHWFCIVAIFFNLRSRSFTQAGPWTIATQVARNTLPRRDLGF